jgi:phage FluMu protein Com
MPYLRCPNCGLLAHLIAGAHNAELHCPRCRAIQQQIGMVVVEESPRYLSTAPERETRPAR